MNIGEPVRRIYIDPIEIPVPMPDRAPVEPEPTYVPEQEPVLVP